ncbi:alpha/beta hydrolase [Bacillus thuringiensis]|uniref:alpha/beta fold hydrolase n=1 Tax=Bacillus cereus group TaxID=86661 RepID=UPI000424CA2B|nr:alpha/beta hydrolase [Bacillus cereus]MED2786787.1 alpha/beta hydrolase [Bacillus thuringiensis]MED2811300.1 alpha/beta hydrolase [Bacillus thuringiensis]MED2829019.1 alpha/beta hydrolase [Bacillus thuringiensis]MED2831578.1 alpha/beta hydrolase [Bacillus thuringiensis]MED2851545.1 alpha/beta hydrolase [Bacillus thuringiensis]
MGYLIPVESDVRIFVEDINSKGKKTILFIHGWPLNHKQFEYQYNVLPAMGYRCIGIDWRGYGNSDKPYSGYNFDRLADDIAVVIKALQLKDVTLAGHSTGGAISIRYMARYQGFGVSKLVLIGAASPTSVEKEIANKFITDTLNDRPNMLQGVTNQFFFQKITGPFSEWFLQLGLEATSWSTAAIMRTLRDENVYSDLGKINVQTLIIHGIHDKIVPFTKGEETQKLLGNAQLVPFQFSGHGTFWEEREKFNQVLIQFIG